MLYTPIKINISSKMLEGKYFNLLVFLAVVISMWFFMRKAEKGNPPKIREIPLLQELDSIVGRAAEMGKPIHFTTGYGGLHDEWAVMCVAGLAILGKVAETCGKYRVPIQFTCFRGYLVPIGQDIIKAGYEKGGNPDMYSPNMVTYIGEDQPAYIAFIMDYFMTAKPAVSMIFGAIQAEMNNVLMQAARIGAVSIAGTPRLYYQGKMALMCDYALLGEELYVAGAAITGDPVHLGCIEAEDWFKIGIIVLFILAAIFASIGVPQMFQSLLKW
jgi:hypothetical protein